MAQTFAESAQSARTLLTVRADSRDADLSSLTEAARAFVSRTGFKGGAGEMLVLPEGSGVDAIIGLGKGEDPLAFGSAPYYLEACDWQITGLPATLDPTQVMVAWAMGAYKFDRYKAAPRAPARLAAPEGADIAEAARLARSIRLARDMVNTPAEDMGPDGIQTTVEAVADEFGATVRVTKGDQLLKDNYPMIHAVGRAAEQEPRLIEMEWGDEAHPRVALIGKGVAFDSGGLDIKPAAGMRLMKKDMGGAANALALARLIMDAKLPVRLHLLISAVENAISGNAFRPGDILDSRAGLTVEIDNTDAEGRLVLGDALARATEEDVDLVLDFATLTGAARIALGPELAPFYTDDESLAEAINQGAVAAHDPVWRMPLWDGYDAQLDGTISDLKNTGDGPFAGSVTAALFLRRFVKGKRWAHFDIFAWNPKDKPGRPMGGEMLGSRAAWSALKSLYGKG
ncbi:leucyl aminopeptidase family protein [Hyphobacterium marinum]|uniref:Leucyl aminopeptidase family protein n=1 Tax=Hyphobacterium marinum TaxID=3116574 RepID=A0ABU7LXR6_9PROT|nr:leucyl aminopeptidase family protein [Hyphobacterium sp. Y6023]MEE2565800.1 leucyl aminopeptidase family protein [Hyphobacterium sp. Y6023]